MEKVVVEKGIQENSVSRMKRFEDLTFTDDFMFCTTLKENPDLCNELAEMIIGRKISEIVSVQKQWWWRSCLTGVACVLTCVWRVRRKFVTSRCKIM